MARVVHFAEVTNICRHRNANVRFESVEAQSRMKGTHQGRGSTRRAARASCQGVRRGTRRSTVLDLASTAIPPRILKQGGFSRVCARPRPTRSDRLDRSARPDRRKCLRGPGTCGRAKNAHGTRNPTRVSRGRRSGRRRGDLPQTHRAGWVRGADRTLRPANNSCPATAPERSGNTKKAPATITTCAGTPGPLTTWMYGAHGSVVDDATASACTRRSATGPDRARSCASSPARRTSGGPRRATDPARPHPRRTGGVTVTQR